MYICKKKYQSLACVGLEMFPTGVRGIIWFGGCWLPYEFFQRMDWSGLSDPSRSPYDFFIYMY